MLFEESVQALVERPESLRATQQDEHDSFLERFPLERWPDMTLDDYALGTGASTPGYSHQLEFGTPNLGSIRGGSATKHVVFRRANGEWSFPSGFAGVDDAWQRLRTGFVRMFELAQAGEWAKTAEIDILRGAKTVRLKSLFLYFPDQVLPIYSYNHLVHFAEELDLDHSGDAIDVNRRILEHLRSFPRLAGVDPLDFIGLLYAWSPPPGYHAPKIWKIAPGPQASLWEECRDGGYICVGWDDVGDLTLFDTEEEFREAFSAHYAAEYNNSKPKITAKGTEVWRLREIKEGDRVIANRGTSQIAGVGTVVSPGYQWRPERDEYKHTITMKWDDLEERTLSTPVKKWAFTTISKVTVSQFEAIFADNDAPADDASTDQAKEAFAHLIEDEGDFVRWNKILNRKGQIVFYGPPGTGKTRAAKRFAGWLLGGDASAPTGGPAEPVPSGAAAMSRLTEVTFHASYAYEDFIEGFRPRSGSTELTLELRPGIMKTVAREADRHPDQRYVILIDEINRADVPRVFGELMTVIERGRRGETVTLPASGEPLSIPPNLIVLGTMNTADQSIRSLDAALRRRFGFVELMPDPEVLSNAVIDDLPLDQFLIELNRRITRIAGRERQVGHSFFLDGGKPIESAEDFGDIIRTDIIPLLQEIVYDDYNALAQFLGPDIVDVGEQQLHTLIDDDSLLVASLVAAYEIKAQTDDAE
ncbi:AAA domain-containing protein [Gordonia amarae]|uniref:5-methylcytosine-specific restriction enzyme B n=2 Tax=Gordonia amarae TaxID=36821 RepID=G7GS20_9ACTN|nr:AAA family ATPase [Gordonia amarae]MCS3879476.1 5-methylcytosine-specific restriction protein B [Gordonia amarae]QHN17952.1 AAA domain-containing protein [Gordonia amarae]QHN22472.1 AAA domain-containing protein [Gordonia amarae]QHN31338.1 AAA domain-containing protein [Gordonia amarae]QHN40083.1 AAA domain-containing protein [Gordonia amarae]